MNSRGFQAFREYLADYTASDSCTSLVSATGKRYADLAAVKYSIHMRGNRVRVTRYGGEPDYSAEVEKTFTKFKQGAVKDYRVGFRDGPDMNHVEARILDLVARLYPEVYQALDDYCTRHQHYLDDRIAAFDREVQFYISYLEFIEQFRRVGLSFTRLFLPDQMFTHLEKEEDIATLRGKLEDELTRIHQILQQAISNSVLIMNESFTSTTLADALFLGTEVMQRIRRLELLCVYVTFVDEMASLSAATVSMVSTIVPDNPAVRTYKVVRKPADGFAYAAAIAEKYGLTCERVKERIPS